MNTSSSRSKAKTLAAVLLLGILAGCAGGSKSSSCTNCVPPVKLEFLYATALNQIALFNVDTTDGTLTLPLGSNAGTFIHDASLATVLRTLEVLQFPQVF